MATEATPLLPNNQNTQGQIRNGRLYLASFSAVLGSFIFGYAMVFPSAAIPQLQKEEDPSLRLDVGQISWFGSVFAIGAIVGGLTAMVLNDRIGRRHSIMVSVIPSTAGFFVMALAKGWLWLLLGRLFTGIAAGITAGSIPVYVSEISHPGVRGFLGSSTQTMTVIGGLALYALGLVLPWRWLAVAGEVPGLIMLLLLCFMPSSPRYLLTKGKLDEAKKALRWLRGPQSDYESELQQIEQSVKSQHDGMRWSELVNPFYLKPILISVFMRILQQMTGITPILVYMEPIFEKTAVSLEPKFDAAIVGLFRLVPVLIAAFIMDKTGRKSLLHASAFIMYLSMMVLGVYTHKTSCNGNATIEALSAIEPFGSMSGFQFSSGTLIPLMSIVFTVLGYAVGWGPITWLLMSEILPVRVRGIVSGVCVVASYITAFLLTQFFMQAVDAFGLYVPFLFFSAICVLNIIFTAKCIPETKGRTLEEIEDYFRNGIDLVRSERNTNQDI